jgi:hypothetical protein
MLLLKVILDTCVSRSSSVAGNEQVESEKRKNLRRKGKRRREQCTHLYPSTSQDCKLLSANEARQTTCCSLPYIAHMLSILKPTEPMATVIPSSDTGFTKYLILESFWRAKLWLDPSWLVIGTWHFGARTLPLLFFFFQKHMPAKGLLAHWAIPHENLTQQICYH